MIGDYISFVVVGKSQWHKAWHWETWSQVATSLNPIVAATNEKVGVRSIQGHKETNKQISFGRLNWDRVSHQKWTHGSELTQGTSNNWDFFNTEIWAPMWTVCRHERRNPALFIKIENPFTVIKQKKGQYNQFIQLSVTLNLFDSAQELIESAIEQTYDLLDGVLKAIRIAPWNHRGDSIQDALNNHLHYIGMYDDLVPDLTRTRGGWLEWQRGVIPSLREV